jgi:hypothetical protein
MQRWQSFFDVRSGTSPRVPQFFKRQVRGLSVEIDCPNPIMEVQ